VKVVLVKFHDPTTFGSWETMDYIDCSEPRLALACGFLIEDNDKLVKVCLLLGQDKAVGSNWITIPAGCIVSVDELKEVDWGEV